MGNFKNHINSNLKVENGYIDPSSSGYKECIDKLVDLFSKNPNLIDAFIKNYSSKLNSNIINSIRYIKNAKNYNELNNLLNKISCNLLNNNEFQLILEYYDEYLSIKDPSNKIETSTNIEEDEIEPDDDMLDKWDDDNKKGLV